MNWPVLLLLLAVVVAFYVFQLMARLWIMNKWIDEGLTDRQAGLLFVLSSTAPYIALLVGGALFIPEVFPILALIAFLVTVPTIVLNFALFDSKRGHRDRMRQDRAAKVRLGELPEKAPDR